MNQLFFHKIKKLNVCVLFHSKAYGAKFRFFNWLNHTNMLDGCSRQLINPELGCLRYLSSEDLPLAWRAGSSRTSRKSLAALLLSHKKPARGLE